MFCLCTLYISQEDSSSSIYFLDSKATMLLKSFSSQFKLILESVNSQYDKRLFIQFPEKYKFTYCFECQNITKNNFCTKHDVNLYFSGNSMNNFLSYCG